MEKEEFSVREISSKLQDMGDYVKMDYLRRCLQHKLDFESRKFVLVTLAGIYEARGMFNDGGKLFRSVSEVNTNDENRVNDLIKSSELFIKACLFDEADVSYRRALSLVKDIEKNRVKEGVKGFYKAQAKILVSKGKRRIAASVYEKLLSDFDLDVEEKRFAETELLFLYEKLGKIREYSALRENKR